MGYWAKMLKFLYGKRGNGGYETWIHKPHFGIAVQRQILTMHCQSETAESGACCSAIQNTKLSN